MLKETIKRFVQGVNMSKRSQVQGLTFKVTDKDKDESPKSSEETAKPRGSKNYYVLARKMGMCFRSLTK